ncbi:MAG: hypothetical protein V4591_03470 [Bdellovibrionota bacterium]
MIRYISFIAVLFYCSSICAQTSMLDENDFNSNKYEEIFSNRSILGCGADGRVDVYSSLDIQALLSISNAVSAVSVSQHTNWENFTPPPFTSVNFSEARFKALPDDVKRILFLCLTWNESERLKLFVIPDAALDNISKRLHEERPWKNLDAKLVKKLDALSNETLKEFVYIVLRADVFESARGGLLENKSLWFISWNWLTENHGINE